MTTPTMHVDVVSAEEQIYSGEAEFLVAPAEEGEIGVYPRHVPLLTRIKPGVLRLTVPGSKDEVLVAVSGGERIEIGDGRMRVPTRPGLGLSLSEQARRWTTASCEVRA